ncbi:FAD-dependent oxidoreductase [Streptomyces prunicolor]|uniref:FAD-dependent oxidoreductase n=1 Tax=Streptomyces prunicolor TaxID=67348 RepID=UPI002255CA08|nr:FAD-dependent oxidoreductase [Streptomyces prunicolor]MCX5242512.1 FAD-dependent oxidoreductase [Streptomyces prunicolor]
MFEPAYQADVVVVGAGVAGLAAAHRLISAGVTTAVLEAAPYVGGRMSTEKVDGFRLDRIGQFLSTSYPELRLTPGLDALVLRPFAPGVLLHSDGRHHHAGTPAPGGSAWGALHAVRALASAPRSGAVRKGPLWGGPVTRGRGGVSWAAAAPEGRATLGDRTEGAFGDGAEPDQAATRGALRGRAGSPWGGPTLRDRAGSTWGGLPPKDRTGPSWGALTPRNRADSSWGGPALKERSVDARGSSVVPRSRSGAPLGGPVDQARLGTALTRLAGTPVERLLSRPELAAGQALAARGVPARTIDGFLRPLLAALLCDPELTTSSRCADLALRAFAGGRLCVPEGGAEMLPEVLAAALPPGTVHTGVRVTAVSTTSVTTAEHGEIHCRAVLVATDARAAAELLPGLRVPDFHPVTVVHHTTDDPPTTGAALLLDSDRGGPVAHTAIVSEVDPSRAPAGRALVSSTVLGPPPPDIDTAVRMHLSRLYGTSTTRWETLAVHHTPTAVPVMRPPHDLRRPVRLLAGLYVCGDHRDTSTVQGALHSGHRASSAILADLGAAASMHQADPIPTTQAA